MTKRNFTGRVVVLFCCLAGLTWAGSGLIDSWSYANVGMYGGECLVGWNHQECYWRHTCAKCYKGSHHGSPQRTGNVKHLRENDANGNPVMTAYYEYRVNELSNGTSGCETLKYKVCAFLLCRDCNNDKTCSCGKVVKAYDNWVEGPWVADGRTAVFAHRCDTRNDDCGVEPVCCAK